MNQVWKDVAFVLAIGVAVLAAHMIDEYVTCKADPQPGAYCPSK